MHKSLTCGGERGGNEEESRGEVIGKGKERQRRNCVGKEKAKDWESKRNLTELHKIKIKGLKMSKWNYLSSESEAC